LTNLLPNIDLAKSIVAEISPSKQNNKYNKASIIDTVSNHFGLSPQLLLGNSRNRRCVTARQICMYVLREDLNLSLAEISQITGKKHSSVIYSCNQIINGLSSNPKILSDITAIRSIIKRKTGN
jgi:chromosomal replication initiator protein